MSFETALGGMRDIPQWFIWRLEWNAAEAKYNKAPCALDGSVYRIDGSVPANWNTFDVTLFHQRTLNSAPQCADRTLQYALGFWMTADCGYWFLDLDKCGKDGELLPFAAAMVDAFPGAMVEWSSSKRGVHIFGRCIGAIPSYRMKPPREIAQKLLPVQLEFYNCDRGVAFGLDGLAEGNADTVHDAMIAGLVERYFPPRTERDAGEGPRSEWRGPSDDDELIRRALNARQSAESAFGGKASFAQLWKGEGIEKNSEHDMALASHLAFWTGCDEDRIARLMQRSGMVREKWQDRRPHGTYLSFTIANARAGCSSVYQEPAKSESAMVAMYGTPVTTVVAAGEGVITPELAKRVDDLRGEVSACGTFEDMHNIVIPMIRAANIPAVYAEQLAKQINNKLDTCWDAKLPIARLRAMVCPPALLTTKDPPLWVQRHCYVKEGDVFMDMETGAQMTYQGFIAEYGRVMPVKDNGSRENAAEWALHRWNMTTVQKVGYRPDKGPFYTYDGLECTNLYNANSVPIAMPLTQAGIELWGHRAGASRGHPRKRPKDWLHHRSAVMNCQQ
jgi:primase-polymerase (primpol)-like protein